MAVVDGITYTPTPGYDENTADYDPAYLAARAAMLSGGNTSTTNTSAQNTSQVRDITQTPTNIYNIAPVDTNINTTGAQRNTLADLGIVTSPTVDPYTRGLLAQGVQSGQNYNILSQEDYAAQLAQRQEYLRQSVVPSATAALNTGLTQVEKAMQKAGKYSSSATSQAMMRTSEQYAADVGATMAQGTLNIYSQLDELRNSELNRILASGQTATQADIDVYQTNVAAISQDIARVSNERIAQVNANVALSAQQKDIEIAKINAETQKQVAQLESETSLALQAGEQKFLTDPETGKPNWLLGLDLSKLDVTEKYATIREQMQQDQTQFNMSNQTTRDTFFANLAYLEKSGDLDRNQAYQIFKEQLAFDKSKFDLTRADSREQFKASLDWAKEQFNISQSDMKELTYAQLDENMRQFDLSRSDQISQFQASLDWSKEQGYMDDQRIRDLQHEAIKEQAREFDISTTNDLTKWSATFNETMRQFNVSTEQQRWYANESLSIARQNVSNSVLANKLDVMIEMSSNPLFSDTVTGITGDGTINEAANDAFNTWIGNVVGWILDEDTVIGSTEPPPIPDGVTQTDAILNFQKYLTGDAQTTAATTSVTSAITG